MVNLDPSDPSITIESEYSSIISQYISYFTELPDEGKKRFLERTIHFRGIKHFSYLGMDERREVPVLISAAAVLASKNTSFHFLKIFT